MTAAPHEAELVRANRPLAPAAQYTARDWEVDDVTITRLAESIPVNTKLAYENVRDRFKEWCEGAERVGFPATAETLAAYVSALITKGQAPATISQHIGAIRKMHSVAGHKGQPDSEAALQLLRGYRRLRAENGLSEGQALPLLLPALRQCIDTLDLETLSGRRDQLVLVLGFGMMARRSELARLTIGDVVETEDGIEVLVRTSKTDKDSRGAVVAIPPSAYPQLDVVQLSRRWKADLAGAGITEGPLLRGVTRTGKLRGGITPQTVGAIVRRTVKDAGLPNAGRYSAHSLRAGGLTASLKAGIPLAVAAVHGRWSTSSPVVIGYARAADRWRDNAMRGVL